METKQEILDFLQKEKSKLREKFFVTRIALFGSFARDKQDKNSDIDLLIELDSSASNIHDLKNSLKAYLSDSLGRKIDLAREKYLKPYAREHILKEAIFV